MSSRNLYDLIGIGSSDPHLEIVDPNPGFGVDPDPDPDPGTYSSIIIFFLFSEINNLHFITL